MNSILTNEQFQHSRPQGFIGEGDQYLFPLINRLHLEILNFQQQFKSKGLSFENIDIENFAWVLIEFAEDLHNDIGFWNSIEEYNLSLYGTCLPLILDEGESISECFDKNRVKYFIYNIIKEYDSSLIISPALHELDILSNIVSDFFKIGFKDVPKDSGIKIFINQNDKSFDNIRNIFFWFATKGYLVRQTYRNFFEEEQEDFLEALLINDFVNQYYTIWSGLGVRHILAYAMKLSENLINDIDSWDYPISSLFRHISSQNNIIILENLINNAIYKVYNYFSDTIRLNGHFVFGSIIPYSDLYYFTGDEHIVDKLNKSGLKDALIEFKRTFPSRIYFFDKKGLNEMRDILRQLYQDFVKFFGDDILISQSGEEINLRLDEFRNKSLKTRSPKKQSDSVKKYQNIVNRNIISFSRHLVSKFDSVALYFNPEEGFEIIPDINHVIKALEKQGKKLDDEDYAAINSLITSKVISCNLVRKLIGRYGQKSITGTFFIDDTTLNIEILLRKFKGHFFRNRYPFFSNV